MPAIIALADNHPDAPKFWHGYEPNPTQAGGGCHRWLHDQRGAVRFVGLEDARKSGVGAPNTAQGRHDDKPGRGVKMVIVDE